MVLARMTRATLAGALMVGLAACDSPGGGAGVGPRDACTESLRAGSVPDSSPLIGTTSDAAHQSTPGHGTDPVAGSAVDLIDDRNVIYPAAGGQLRVPFPDEQVALNLTKIRGGWLATTNGRAPDRLRHWVVRPTGDGSATVVELAAQVQLSRGQTYAPATGLPSANHSFASRTSINVLDVSLGGTSVVTAVVSAAGDGSWLEVRSLPDLTLVGSMSNNQDGLLFKNRAWIVGDRVLFNSGPIGDSEAFSGAVAWNACTGDTVRLPDKLIRDVDKRTAQILLLQRRDDSLMLAPVRDPARVATIGGAALSNSYDFRLSPDGTRLVAIKRTPEAAGELVSITLDDLRAGRTGQLTHVALPASTKNAKLDIIDEVGDRMVVAAVIDNWVAGSADDSKVDRYQQVRVLSCDLASQACVTVPPPAGAAAIRAVAAGRL